MLVRSPVNGSLGLEQILSEQHHHVRDCKQMLGRPCFERGGQARSTQLVGQCLPASTSWSPRSSDTLVYAEPTNTADGHLLADAFEQIGYQQESATVRNAFLAAALELRSGIPEGASPKSGGPDVIRALRTSHFLDFLGIRLDSAKAGDAAWTINLVTPDNGEQFVIELSNGTLTNLEGFLAEKPDLTITVDRANLEHAMTGAAPLLEQANAGVAVLEGDVSIFPSLADMLSSSSSVSTSCLAPAQPASVQISIPSPPSRSTVPSADLPAGFTRFRTDAAGTSV